MAKSELLKSSIKVAMALSGLFDVVFSTTFF
jgi:hypothetical protein